MHVLRLWVPALSILFGLSCVIWAIVDSSVPVGERGGGAFLGVIFLLLALVYGRVLLREQEEHVPSERV